MVRVKLVAVLLGPTGMGLVGLYDSATSLVGVFAGLGIGSSGVREVAEAHGSGDPERVARAVTTLRRACWVTGLFGWLLTIALSYPLSLWTFGSGERTVAISILGLTLLLGSVANGQSALLQGTRRIGDLARLSVCGVLAGTVVAVGLYACLREEGIVPVLLATAAVNLGFSWWFARRIQTVTIEQGWGESWHHSKRFVRLGLAFMWSSLLAAGVALAIRSIIVRDLGLDANGIYQAAWGMSGMFAGFILGAMGADFYPRLTAVADDNTAVNRLVNEQTEIGILLALPGIMATLTFAPWMMRIFYTDEFITGGELLPWFVLGIFGRVISWPMGFIQLAKGASSYFAATESIFVALHLGLSVLLLRWLGLWGVALAFAIHYWAYVWGMLFVSAHLSGFRWSTQVIRLVVFSTTLVSAGFCIKHWTSELSGMALGGILTAIALLFSMRGITARLGFQHILVRFACRLPGGRFVCGI
jgi:antigen flippase